MRPTIFISLMGLLLTTVRAAMAQGDWVPITKPTELRKLFSGKTVQMYKTRIQYYRKDGKMIEYDSSYRSYLARKWTIDNAAKLCWKVFGNVDRIIDCATVFRNSASPTQFRFRWTNAKGASPVTVISGSTKKLIDALDKKAGFLKD